MGPPFMIASRAKWYTLAGCLSKQTGLGITFLSPTSAVCMFIYAKKRMEQAADLNVRTSFQKHPIEHVVSMGICIITPLKEQPWPLLMLGCCLPTQA